MLQRRLSLGAYNIKFTVPVAILKKTVETEENRPGKHPEQNKKMMSSIRQSILQQTQSAQLKPRGGPTVTPLNTFWHVSCRICLLNQQLKSLF